MTYIYKDPWDISDWFLLARESSNGYVFRMIFFNFNTRRKQPVSLLNLKVGSLVYRITLCPFSLWILRPLLTSHTLRKSKTKLKFCQTDNDSWRKRMVESRCIYLEKKKWYKSHCLVSADYNEIKQTRHCWRHRRFYLHQVKEGVNLYLRTFLELGSLLCLETSPF